MNSVERDSPCKVNLLLNVLGKRADGFHEVETVMQPVQICDHLDFRRQGKRIELTCNNPALPVDANNLVWRAAEAYLSAAGIVEGLRIHLDKRIPLAAGLGGGSSNAAITLLALNELFDGPLSSPQIAEIASSLGSDVPFFLQRQPALATGRGEIIDPLAPFPALKGLSLVLMHPGFGVSTAWTYQQLPRFPEALRGRPGLGRHFVAQLQRQDPGSAVELFYNALEAPVLAKYPLLALYQEFLRSHGALVALMSGSGSSTFALVRTETAGPLVEALKAEFTPSWIDTVPVAN